MILVLSIENSDSLPFSHSSLSPFASVPANASALLRSCLRQTGAGEKIVNCF
ncbi:MAG TPA: hypothetical protein PK910_07015 [Bacteroidales bacterium]|nr:hypothetical protein [Bacteroidales bacterium]HRC89750.1 hypothetical protein [Bacteroidales bacterium]